MNTLTLPTQNRLYVVIGRHAATGQLLDLSARLALLGPIQILDCGNRANPYPLIRELRRLTGDPVRALQQVQMARAFTCYQVNTLLDEAASRQAPSKPVLVFDLLSSFYDESVSYGESRRLLELALKRIKEISSRAPVVVSAAPPPTEFPQRKAFGEHLCSLADEIWEEVAPLVNQPMQLPLFAPGG